MKKQHLFKQGHEFSHGLTEITPHKKWEAGNQ